MLGGDLVRRVARPDARELAVREGTPGVRGALAELVDGLEAR